MGNRFSAKLLYAVWAALAVFWAKEPLAGPAQGRGLEYQSVEFADGRTFRLGAKVGEGSRTVIYELADHPKKVIRIPMDERERALIRETVQGERVLREAGLDLPKIHGPVSPAYDYLVVEKIPLDHTFEDLVNEKLDSRLRTKMLDELEGIARKAARFSRLLDFRPDQFVFDATRGKWVLLDWRDGAMPAIHQTSSGGWEVHTLNPFTHFFSRDYLTVAGKPLRKEYGWIAEFHQKIQRAIQEQQALLLQTVAQKAGKGGRASRGCLTSRLGRSALLTN